MRPHDLPRDAWLLTGERIWCLQSPFSPAHSPVSPQGWSPEERQWSDLHTPPPRSGAWAGPGNRRRSGRSLCELQCVTRPGPGNLGTWEPGPSVSSVFSAKTSRPPPLPLQPVSASASNPGTALGWGSSAPWWRPRVFAVLWPRAAGALTHSVLEHRASGYKTDAGRVFVWGVRTSVMRLLGRQDPGIGSHADAAPQAPEALLLAALSRG